MALRSRQKLDAEKSLEVLLYVAKRMPVFYRTLKIIYFADKCHLASHGRLMYGESYRAMESGPVPSLAYDIIKQVQGTGRVQVEGATEAFHMDDFRIVPMREPDLDLLSESERECLDAIIAECGTMSGGELKVRSHDAAYKAVPRNKMMPLEVIAGDLPDADVLLDYLENG